MIGRYERLNEQPMASRSSLPFVCLTDDPDLTSETWRIVRIKPIFHSDSIRSQRMLKLLPHRYVSDFERSLYIDNSVILNETPEKIFAEYLVNCAFALPTHGFRNSVRDEFAEVLNLRLDDPERLSEQLKAYEAYDPAALDERPYWSGILLRDHFDSPTREALEIWAMHVLRFSRRDQLSANYAFRRAGRSPSRIEMDTQRSWFHTWPVIEDRKADIREFRPRRHDPASAG
jgi:hypothetical protein